MYLLRVELPDRPGALGAVASRIGAVRADVVALDIVGRGDGRAVDEFVVELADESHVSLLLSEVAEVDGVEVEEVRILPSALGDRRLDAYDTAAALLGERTPDRVLTAVAERATYELRSSWTTIVDVESRLLVAVHGRPPAAPWLTAYIEGTRWHQNQADVHLGAAEGGSDSRPVSSAAPGTPTRPAVADVAWAELRSWDLVLAVGRPGWPYGEEERNRLRAIAKLADLRWADLADRDTSEPQPNQPSQVG